MDGDDGDRPTQIYPDLPRVTVIPPTIQCHLCLDLVHIGIIEPEEAHPAYVILPHSGSICHYHHVQVVPNLHVTDEERIKYRADLTEKGYLVEPKLHTMEDIDGDDGWDHTMEDIDREREARERVLRAVIIEPGTRDQAIEGLTALADEAHGPCRHPVRIVGRQAVPSNQESCVRCQARKFLKLLHVQEAASD